MYNQDSALIVLLKKNKEEITWQQFFMSSTN